jgi:hypothetical protein
MSEAAHLVMGGQLEGTKPLTKEHWGQVLIT